MPKDMSVRFLYRLSRFRSINLNCLSLFSVPWKEESPESSSFFRSPRRSSSLVTPKISAMTGMSDKSGVHSSHSQRLIVLSDTKRRSPSSFCVIPFALRKADMNLPIVFFSIVILLVFRVFDTIILPLRQREYHPVVKELLSLCEILHRGYFHENIRNLFHRFNGYKFKAGVEIFPTRAKIWTR